MNVSPALWFLHKLSVGAQRGLWLCLSENNTLVKLGLGEKIGFILMFAPENDKTHTLSISHRQSETRTHCYPPPVTRDKNWNRRVWKLNIHQTRAKWGGGTLQPQDQNNLNFHAVLIISCFVWFLLFQDTNLVFVFWENLWNRCIYKSQMSNSFAPQLVMEYTRVSHNKSNQNFSHMPERAFRARYQRVWLMAKRTGEISNFYSRVKKKHNMTDVWDASLWKNRLLKPFQTARPV